VSANGFPGRLRRYRERQFWTQRQLAQQSGVPYRTIQNWEEGRSRPHPGSWQLLRVAELFRVAPKALVHGEEKHANH